MEHSQTEKLTGWFRCFTFLVRSFNILRRQVGFHDQYLSVGKGSLKLRIDSRPENWLAFSANPKRKCRYLPKHVIFRGVFQGGLRLSGICQRIFVRCLVVFGNATNASATILLPSQGDRDWRNGS